MKIPREKFNISLIKKKSDILWKISYAFQLTRTEKNMFDLFTIIANFYWFLILPEIFQENYGPVLTCFVRNPRKLINQLCTEYLSIKSNFKLQITKLLRSRHEVILYFDFMFWFNVRGIKDRHNFLVYLF